MKIHNRSAFERRHHSRRYLRDDRSSGRSVVIACSIIAAIIGGVIGMQVRCLSDERARLRAAPVLVTPAMPRVQLYPNVETLEYYVPATKPQFRPTPEPERITL